MIQDSLTEQLYSICNLVQQLTEIQYSQPSGMLSNASIGQHVRHVAELVQCLNAGYHTGMIDYDQRKRDTRIETDRAFALQVLEQQCNSLPQTDKWLQQAITIGNKTQWVDTSYNREVFYNTEHAIHHMALIRVALREMGLHIVPDQFGVAYATLQYKQTACAQ
jgi:uncharacterized damage-inducible protein DinB